MLGEGLFVQLEAIETVKTFILTKWKQTTLYPVLHIHVIVIRGDFISHFHLKICVKCGNVHKTLRLGQIIIERVKVGNKDYEKRERKTQQPILVPIHEVILCPNGPAHLPDSRCPAKQWSDQKQLTYAS